MNLFKNGMKLLIFCGFLVLHAMEEKEKEIVQIMAGKEIMVPENGGVYLFYNPYEGWQITDQLSSDIVEISKPLIVNLCSPNVVKNNDDYKVEGNHYYQVLRTVRLEQANNNQSILNLDISSILVDLNELILGALHQKEKKIQEQEETIRSLCESSNNIQNQDDLSNDRENSFSAFINKNRALTYGVTGVGLGILLGLIMRGSSSSGN